MMSGLPGPIEREGAPGAGRRDSPEQFDSARADNLLPAPICCLFGSGHSHSIVAGGLPEMS
jgi:hypothetical protein